MMFKKEIWKNINNFNGDYKISNYGDIKSFKRDKNGRLLKPSLKSNGYYFVCLYPNKVTLSIHRLVAEHFIPNPDNKPEINHKDGNKLNNHVHNLEWCTKSENKIHALQNNLISNLRNGELKQSKKIGKYTLQGKLVNVYDSLQISADKNELWSSNIKKCCEGKRKTCGGYQWKYIEELNNKNKIKKVKSGKERTQKELLQLDLNGNLIKKYSSIKEACEEHDTTHTSIWRVCTGKQNTLLGYKWKYKT